MSPELKFEPKAIWSTTKRIAFDRGITVVQNIILSHARVALQSVIERIDEVRRLVSQDNLIEHIYSEPAVPGLLTDLCFQQGLAATILFKDGIDRRESEGAAKSRKDRVALVSDWCKHLPITILKDRELRHSLTHVDERLADNLMSTERTGWVIDSAIETRDVKLLGNQLRKDAKSPSGLKIKFCRSYIASEDVLLHFDHEISLEKLREEANMVLAAVHGVPPVPVPQLPARKTALTKALPFGTRA